MNISLVKRQLVPWGTACLTLVTLTLVVLLALAGAGRATARSAKAAATPLATIYAIPGSDGTSLYVAAGRLGAMPVPVYANVTVVGPTSYERSHTMSYDPDSGEYSHAFEGLFTARTQGEGTIAITSTVTPMLGLSDYVRHYVAGPSVADLRSKDGNVRLFISPDGLPPATYLLIMSTAAPPGDPPPGHRLIGQPYTIRASGALTQSLKPLLLWIRYNPLPEDIDPHTLSIFYWREDEDPALRRWQNIESDPFGEDPVHVKSVRRFGTYALMASTTWRDTFQDYNGVDAREHVRIAYGGRLALGDNETEGFAVSVPITPPDPFSSWGQLRYTTEIAAGTALTIDVLAADGALLLANVAGGASLAGIDPAEYPGLRLRATLSTDQPNKTTPYLDDWGINWTAEAREHRLYLPVLLVETGRQGSKETRGQGSKSRPPVTLSPHHLATLGCDPPPTQPIVWSPPVALTAGNGIALAPELAVDGDNRLHAVWYDGSRTVLYASKEPDAATWTTPVSISSSGAAYYPHVAVDPQGNVHVIWEENDDIFYATKPRSGGWSSPVDLSNTGQANIMPALYVDADGNLHAVWSDGSPGNDEILYAFKGSGASAWSVPERVSSTPGRSLAPAVVTDSQGAVHVVWHDFTPGPTEIYYAMKPAGGSWRAFERVSYTIGASVFPALAVTSDGTVHVVWQDSVTITSAATSAPLSAGLSTSSSPSPPFEILYATKPAGGAWSSYLQLSGSTGNAETPALAVGPEDALHVAWDTTDTRGLLYVQRPGPDMGWTTPMTVTTISAGTQYPFPALAASPTKAIHLLWSDHGSSNIFHSTAAPPPIPEDHVLVRDEAGFAVSGACVYQDGQLAGTTNKLGIFAPNNLELGDHLMALKPVAEQAGRGKWAYRTALTSWEMDADGAVSGHPVTAPGRQSLTVHKELPLVYFNLIISIQWNATHDYIQDIAEAARHASNYLFDISDGQMAFGHVAIYDDGGQWGNADIQILVRNNVVPYAYVGGIVSPAPSQVLRLGRGWDGDSGAQGPWRERNGFRTLVHEFGHYALHLYDSYFEYTFDDDGNLTGVNKNTGCTKTYYKDYDEATDATNATIMDYQYRTSELAAKGVPGLWRAQSCKKTAQWQLTKRELGGDEGESDWETLLRYYADRAEPPRWRFISPFERSAVLAGPDELPANLLPFPLIEIHEIDLPAPVRQVTVLGPNGRPYEKGALVALDTRRGGKQVTLDQGLTATEPITRSGQIAIYGAANDNNLVRAVSIDGASSAQTAIVTDTLAYTLTLRRSGGLRAASAPVNPYASLIPSSDGRDLTLVVDGVGADGALTALVVHPGPDFGQAIELGYSPESGAYQGVASFATSTTGLGSVHVRGLAALGQLATIDSDYHLARVDVTDEQDLYTPDGGAWLHLDAGSFATSNVYIVLMPTGAVPQPLLEGMTIIGNAYSLRVSGGIMVTERPGVLRLFYDPSRLGIGIDPATMQIARWDGVNWRLLPSQSDPERFAISARTSHLGIYALLAADAEEPAERVYLPIVGR